jgi:hypothetical protein
MARDPLIVLARLRALQRDAARRDLADAQGRLAAAEADARNAEADLAREAGAPGVDYAAWLPAARAAREAATAGVARAEAGVTVARGALVEARAAAESVDQLLATRRAARRAARLARDQAAMEDVPRRDLP